MTNTSAPQQDATRAQRLKAQGRSLRSRLPRPGQREFRLPADRDPIGILLEQNARRIPDLVPVRMGRMLQSPFSYYRGTAGPMAYDLSASPTTDLRVVCCGDAHVSNFGFFASPERALLFDLNDFDEAAVAPWEWDVRRLAASVHIAGRDDGLREDQCQEATHAAVAAYQETLAGLMRRTALDRFFSQVDIDQVESLISSAGDRKLTERVARKARRRTSDQVLERMTVQESDGRRTIVDQPPITRHVEGLSLDGLRAAYLGYMATLREDAATVLSQFDLVDVVLRVVGVGSVGTFCYLGFLEGAAGEPLFLQVKEAGVSVLVRYGGMPGVIAGARDSVWADRFSTVPIRSQGHRVVAAQRVLQAQSDPFLGWHGQTASDLAGSTADAPRDFYFRQFRDMKGSIDLSSLDSAQLTSYVRLCGALLARAHSQSPLAHAVCGYLGKSDSFATALAEWAKDYADLCEKDFSALRAAARAGRIPVETGI